MFRSSKLLRGAVVSLFTVFISFSFAFGLTGWGIKATTMRLLKYNGDVNLINDKEAKTVKEDLRLRSGDLLRTGDASLASVGLDDQKIVTLDEKSRASFSQSGKQLSLDLEQGSLFFNVKKPLEEDESFEIRTSTMITGIRGTSGYIYSDYNSTSLVLTDGKVSVSCFNSATGEKQAYEINAGEKITVIAYPDKDKDSLECVVEPAYGSNLPDFAKDIIREDDSLTDRVLNSTGWENLDSAPESGNITSLSDLTEGVYGTILDYFNNDDANGLLNLTTLDGFRDELPSLDEGNNDHGMFLNDEFIGYKDYYFGDSPDYVLEGDIYINYFNCDEINENSRIFIALNGTDPSDVGYSWEISGFYLNSSDKVIVINPYTNEVLLYGHYGNKMIPFDFVEEN